VQPSALSYLLSTTAHQLTQILWEYDANRRWSFAADVSEPIALAQLSSPNPHAGAN